MKKLLKNIVHTTAGKLSILFLSIGLIMTVVLVTYSASMELLAIPYAMATIGFYGIFFCCLLCAIMRVIVNQNPNKHHKLVSVMEGVAWICSACCLSSFTAGLYYINPSRVPFIIGICFWLLAFSLAGTRILKRVLYFGAVVVVFSTISFRLWYWPRSRTILELLLGSSPMEFFCYWGIFLIGIALYELIEFLYKYFISQTKERDTRKKKLSK
ncbi:MAG: hypothetical protein J6Y85_04835 [Alphaproteobacteria bacterium]|nr:hypothetical protein [Alphaproteobacteria bacterium]